jgi:hypothetical protein
LNDKQVVLPHPRELKVVGLGSKNDADMGPALPRVESFIKGYGISIPIYPCGTIMELPDNLS